MRKEGVVTIVQQSVERGAKGGDRRLPQAKSRKLRQRLGERGRLVLHYEARSESEAGGILCPPWHTLPLYTTAHHCTVHQDQNFISCPVSQ